MPRLVSLLLIALVSTPVAGQSLLRGTVRDGQSGESLAAVTVQIEGTTRGTITNATGHFSLYVERLPAVLVIRHIGYRTARWPVGSGERELLLDLDPVPIRLDEIVISGEDPAVGIMRRVLAEKQRQRAAYGSWYAEVYSRFLLYREGLLVQMTETIDATYWTPSGGNRELVRARRTRPKRTASFRFAGQVPVPNLMDDDVVLFGRRFVGPLHPDAMDTYRFTLAATRRIDRQTVFDIAVSPRNPLSAGFIGALSVLDSTFVVLEARLRPLPGTPWSPPVIARNLRIEQRFGAFRGGVWLPVDMRLEGNVSFGRLGAAYPTARYTQVSSLTLHAVDAPVPDSLRIPSDRLTLEPFADRRDDLFLWNPGLVPPTEAEEAAIARIDPRMTISRAFRPMGLLANYTAVRVSESEPDQEGASLYRFPWVRYDRVDGLFLGVRHSQQIGRAANVTARFGKPLDRPGISHVISASVRRGRLDARVDWRVGTEPVGGERAYGRLIPGILTYLGTDEYNDFLHTRRATAEVGISAAGVRFSLGVRRALDRSIARHADEDGAVVFNDQRPNPEIDDGQYDAALAGMEIRRERVDATLTGAWFRGGAALGEGRVGLRFPTVFGRREDPGLLQIEIRGGVAAKDVPVQFLTGVDVTSGPLTADGALGSARGSPWIARRYGAIHIEQGLSTAVWERLGWLGLASRGFNLALFAAAARVEDRADYFEAGVALSRPFALPLRVQAAVPWDTGRPVFALQLLFSWRK